MFKKTSGPPRRASETPAEAPRRASSPIAASLLGPDLVFEGRISGEGELHVEGVIRGEVHVARLVVGEGARIEGLVRGGQIDVRGRVVGNIEAKSVKLHETARVEGDIIHEQLSIDAGAFFQGRCQQVQEGAATGPALVQPTAELIDLEGAIEMKPLILPRLRGR